MKTERKLLGLFTLELAELRDKVVLSKGGLAHCQVNSSPMGGGVGVLFKLRAKKIRQGKLVVVFF